jgi:hypothetical protein
VDRERIKVHSPSPPSSPARGEDVDKSIMPITDRIEINPKVMKGRAVICGTRVTWASGLIEAQFEPGSHGRVLKNLLGIKNKRKMDQAEAVE